MKILESLKYANLSFRGLKDLPRETMEEVNQKIRLRAIQNVKANLIKYRKNIDEFSEQDVEGLIATEEKEIKDKITKGGLSAVLSFLGLNLFI
tara:strand:+ start:240 stop:518 length:279 start_codon:yes stop_codon:yes gene_type:complete